MPCAIVTVLKQTSSNQTHQIFEWLHFDLPVREVTSCQASWCLRRNNCKFETIPSIPAHEDIAAFDHSYGTRKPARMSIEGGCITVTLLVSPSASAQF
jgi:hypothetical protein